MEPAWQKVPDDLQLSLPAKTFVNLLGGTGLASVSEDVAVVTTSNAYAKDWIENRLGKRIARSLVVATLRCKVLAYERDT